MRMTGGSVQRTLRLTAADTGILDSLYPVLHCAVTQEYGIFLKVSGYMSFPCLFYNNSSNTSQAKLPHAK